MDFSGADRHALECLASIVGEGSFERAACKLNMTQSAISQRLKGLEETVGLVLVVRSRPPQATRVGDVLVRHAKQRSLVDVGCPEAQICERGNGYPYFMIDEAEPARRNNFSANDVFRNDVVKATAVCTADRGVDLIEQRFLLVLYKFELDPRMFAMKLR